MVSEIVLNDNQKLKELKVNEFEFGFRPDYKKIGKYASEDYAHYKNTLNPLAGSGNVDLIVTGRFVNSFFVHRTSVRNGYIFGAKDDNNLIGKYGKDILGLNQETFNKRQSDVYVQQLVYIIKKDYKIA